MLEGVLFDLDGTLLDVDVDEFLRRYFGAVKAFAGPRLPGIDLLPVILAGTEAMQRPHDGSTNRDVFAHEFRSRAGIGFDEVRPIFDEFYRDVFPGIGPDYRGVEGAREAILTARSLGLKVAVATQPIFPLVAIEHRLAWAGLSDLDFDAVTTYETMRACKPLPGFFVQTAAMIGCDPAACIMVGDDRVNDMSASAVGMTTFYVGGDPEAPADARGDMRQLAELIARMAAAD